MKRILAFVFALVGCAAAMQAQVSNLQDDREDSVLNVVAYFCKGDTMKYTYTNAVYKINQEDTITSSFYTRDCMIVVTDSTSKGYKMEMTPLDITLANDSSAEEVRTQMNVAILQAFKGVKIKFRTNEFGEIKSIDNWREVRDLCVKGLAKAFDALYKKAPGMDEFMPRKRLEGLVKQGLNSEAEVRKCVEELPLLFDCHGNQFPLGTTTDVDSTTTLFPTTTRILVTYEDNAEGLGNDYAISSRSVTAIPPKEAAELVGGVLTGLFSDEVADEADNFIADSLSTYFKGDSLKVERWEDYHFFANGWPSRMQTMTSSGFSKQKKVECKSIDWYYRSWRGYTMKDEEAEKKEL